MITHEYHRQNFGGRVHLDEYISDLNIEISPEGYSCKPLCKDGFAYMWAGAKATYGIRKGKVCFEVKIAENLEVSTADFTDIHVVRVGWSTDAATLQLGEDKNSFGYGGTAKKSESRKFSDYGRRFDKGDVVGCYLAIENGWADISYCVNGRHCGSAFKVRWNAEEALFPHVLSKNCRLEVNFGQAPNPYFSLQPGFKLIDHTPVGMRVPAVHPPPNKRNCEIIMMVGLPGVGKSTWAMNYCKIHPSKKYNILGTDAIIDKMRVQGLPRKNNFGGRWDVLIKQASECFNILLKKASLCTRNLILDQTNVYASARKRKVSQYKDAGYTVNAMVLVPTDEDMLRRSRQRTLEEGKEVPEAAVYDMKANFSLPHENENLFHNITFLELQRKEAETLVMQYNSDANLKGYKSNKRSGVGVNENQRERSESNRRFSSRYRQENENYRSGYSRRKESPEVVGRANDSRYKLSPGRGRSTELREHSPARNRDHWSSWNKNESSDKDSSTRPDHRKREDRNVEGGPLEKYRRNSPSEDHFHNKNLPNKRTLGRSGNDEISSGMGGAAYRQQNTAFPKRRDVPTNQSAFEGNTPYPTQGGVMQLPRNETIGRQKDMEWEYLTEETNIERSLGETRPQQYVKKELDAAKYGSSYIKHAAHQSKNFGEDEIFTKDSSYREDNYHAHISAPQNRKAMDNEQPMFRHNMDKQILDPEFTPIVPHLSRDKHEMSHSYQEDIATGSRSWVDNKPSRSQNLEFNIRTPYLLSSGKKENFDPSNERQETYLQGQTEYGWNEDINTRESASSEMHKNANVDEYAFNDAREKGWKTQDFHEANVLPRQREYFESRDIVYEQGHENSQKNLLDNRQSQYGTFEDEPYYSENTNKEKFNQQPDFMQSQEGSGYNSYNSKRHLFDTQLEIDSFTGREGYAKKPSHVNDSRHFAQPRNRAVESDQFCNLKYGDRERDGVHSHDPMRGSESDSFQQNEFDSAARNIHRPRSDQRAPAQLTHIKKNENSHFGDGAIKSPEKTGDHQHLRENIVPGLEKQKQFTMYDDLQEGRGARWTAGSSHDFQRKEQRESRNKFYSSTHHDDEFSDSNISKLSSVDYDNLKASLANIRQAQQGSVLKMPVPGNYVDLRESEMQHQGERFQKCLPDAPEHVYLANESQVGKNKRDASLIGSTAVGRTTHGQLTDCGPQDSQLHDAPRRGRDLRRNSPSLQVIKHESQQQKGDKFSQFHGGSLPPHLESAHSSRGRRTDIKSSNMSKPLSEIRSSGQRMQGHHVDNTSVKPDIHRNYVKEGFHDRKERTGADHQHGSRERKRLRDTRDGMKMRGYSNRKFDEKQPSARISKEEFTFCVGQDAKYHRGNDTKIKMMHRPEMTDVEYGLDFEADEVNKSDEWNQAKEAEAITGRLLVSACSRDMLKDLPSLLDIPVQKRPGLLGAHPSSLLENNSLRADHTEVPISREMPIMRMRRPRGPLLETPRLDINLELDAESVRSSAPHAAPKPAFGMGMGQVRSVLPPPGIRDRSSLNFGMTEEHYCPPASGASLHSLNQGLLRRSLRYPVGRGVTRRGRDHDTLGKRLPFRGDGSPERMRYRSMVPPLLRPMRQRFPLGHGLVGRMPRNRMPIGNRSVRPAIPFAMRIRGPRARFG